MILLTKLSVLIMASSVQEVAQVLFLSLKPLFTKDMITENKNRKKGSQVLLCSSCHVLICPHNYYITDITYIMVNLFIYRWLSILIWLWTTMSVANTFNICAKILEFFKGCGNSSLGGVQEKNRSGKKSPGPRDNYR